MKNIVAFTVRNTKLFLRDKATVFFSILSPLIIILLYFLFIGKIYINSIAEKTELITAKGAGFIVYLQMMAGVLILNSMSLALGMFTGAAKDFESQKINSFFNGPDQKARAFDFIFYRRRARFVHLKSFHLDHLRFIDRSRYGLLGKRGDIFYGLRHIDRSVTCKFLHHDATDGFGKIVNGSGCDKRCRRHIFRIYLRNLYAVFLSWERDERRRLVFPVHAFNGLV